MKKKIENINSGKGLGIILFGMQRDDIISILSEPDEVEKYSDEESNDLEDHSESWHYDDYDLSMLFDEENDWKLITLSVTSDHYTFQNQKFIGLTIKEANTQLTKLGIIDVEFEDWSSPETPNHTLLTSESLSINFWFDDDILTEIQWTEIMLEEETFDWPN